MNIPFFGKIAYIDLNRQIATVENVEKEVYHSVIGGKGLGVFLLLKYLPGSVHPLSSDNVFVVSNGPLTGSIYPNSSRVEIVTKSPLTNTFLDSSAGGYLAKQLKKTGLDAIVITGRARNLIYLLIDNESIEFKNASHLSGFSPNKTENAIKKECCNEKLGVLSIGLAGENQVLYSNIATSNRHFGRGGSGAVLGSKNLKAIAISGTKELPWNKDSKFKKLSNMAYKKILQNPLTKKEGPFAELGTQFTINIVNSFGVLPTLNWKESKCDAIENFWPEAFTNIRLKHVGCDRCVINCRRLVKIKKEENIYYHDGPEYESIYALGPNCGIFNAEEVAELDYYCSEYGLDSISTGVTLSFLLECIEKGVITPQDMGGISPTFGKKEELIYLIDEIANQRGFGALLSQGSAFMAEQIGQGTSHFAMNIKGLELPGYDPRGMKAMALLYATSDRGGCHVRGSSLRAELMGLPKPLDRFSYKNKAEIVIHLQREYALMNSLSICLFANFALNFDDYTEVFNQMFSYEYTPRNFKKIGKRIWDLTRLFNSREGFDRNKDILPERLFKDPVPNGPSKNQIIDKQKFEHMKDEYYALNGWEIKTGNPILNESEIFL